MVEWCAHEAPGQAVDFPELITPLSGLEVVRLRAMASTIRQLVDIMKDLSLI